MKHTIKLFTLAFMLATILTLTGCPGPVNNYIEPPVVPEYTITVNVTHGTAEYPATAKAGDSVTITATAEEGFTFDGASSAFNIPDYSVTNNGTVITWNFSMFAEDVVINVAFKVIENDTTDEPEQTTPEDTTENGDTEDEETDNGSEETTTHTHNYEGGGCDVEGCEQRYEFDDYQIEAYIYKVSNNELEQIDTLYFSFDSSELTSPVEMITVWGEVTPSITISNLVHLKTKYINARVTHFIGGDISTLNLSEDWGDDTYPLDTLHTDNPIHIVIE